LSETITTYLGKPAQLAVTASDGRTDLNLRATVFNGNGSAVPIGATNLEHRLIGFYRGEINLPSPGIYRAIYRNFLDAGRTILDPEREHSQDTIIVHPLDQPIMSVGYDNSTDRMLFEVAVSRNGEPILPPELQTVNLLVLDGDDHVLFELDDDAPDSYGVFRMAKDNPVISADRLYYMRVTVTTTAGSVVNQTGFRTTL